MGTSIVRLFGTHSLDMTIFWGDFELGITTNMLHAVLLCTFLPINARLARANVSSLGLTESCFHFRHAQNIGHKPSLVDKKLSREFKNQYKSKHPVHGTPKYTYQVFYL